MFYSYYLQLVFIILDSTQASKLKLESSSVTKNIPSSVSIKASFLGVHHSVISSPQVYCHGKNVTSHGNISALQSPHIASLGLVYSVVGLTLGVRLVVICGLGIVL